VTSARLPASRFDPTGAIRATIAGMIAKRERRSEEHPGGVNIIPFFFMSHFFF